MTKKTIFSGVDAWTLGMTAIAAFIFFWIIISKMYGVIVTQKALNEQCGTNYTALQVALSGDNLARLCQIKNQAVTVK